MKITSPAFSFGDYIPEIFSCDGTNTNPELVFSDVPSKAKSLLLHMYDPDATLAESGTWHHWLLVDLPPDVKKIKKGDDLVGTPCKNSWGEMGYGGPCPPDGPPHRYFFRLIALDRMLGLKEGSTVGDVMDAVNGYGVEQCELMGRYARNRSEFETIMEEIREEEDE